MELQPGETLGPYEIVSFLAAGGMGAVYDERAIRAWGAISLSRSLAEPFQ